MARGPGSLLEGLRLGVSGGWNLTRVGESKALGMGGAWAGLKHLQGLEVQSGVPDFTPVKSLLVLLSDTPNLAKV